VYTPGKANIIADMISRYPMQPIGKNDIIEVNTLSPDDADMPVDYALIASRQAADSKIQSKLFQNIYVTTKISDLSNLQRQNCNSWQLGYEFHPMVPWDI